MSGRLRYDEYSIFFLIFFCNVLQINGRIGFVRASDIVEKAVHCKTPTEWVLMDEVYTFVQCTCTMQLLHVFLHVHVHVHVT